MRDDPPPLGLGVSCIPGMIGLPILDTAYTSYWRMHAQRELAAHDTRDLRVLQPDGWGRTLEESFVGKRVASAGGWMDAKRDVACSGKCLCCRLADGLHVSEVQGCALGLGTCQISAPTLSEDVKSCKAIF